MLVAIMFVYARALQINKGKQKDEQFSAGWIKQAVVTAVLFCNILRS